MSILKGIGCKSKEDYLGKITDHDLGLNQAAYDTKKNIFCRCQEKTREQKEAELIPKMQEAVNYGLKVLESAFEHLDIKAGNSDSEDEEAPDRVEAILEPKV